MKIKIKKIDSTGKIKKKDKESKQEIIQKSENTRSSFTCKIIFGLGITSVTDFVQLCDKYKSVKEAGINYYTANSVGFNKKSKIQVFDSLKEFFRFNKHINESHIVVISEVPAILKEIEYMVPLDYDQYRSFEFNFKPIDINVVIKAIKSKTVKTTSRLISNDNLGYHVDRIKNTSGLIASFISLTSNLPFDSRTVIRKTLFKFFNQKNPDTKLVTSVIKEISKTFKVKEEAKTFIENFEKEADKYHAAINSKVGTSMSTIANQNDVDLYTLSYMKKLMRSMDIVNIRNAKSNVKVLG